MLATLTVLMCKVTILWYNNVYFSRALKRNLSKLAFSYRINGGGFWNALMEIPEVRTVRTELELRMRHEPL